MKKFIFLDRDGVINKNSLDYIKTPEEWHPIDGSLKAIAMLNIAGYEVIVATNQSGITRGLYSQFNLDAIHDKMLKAVEQAGGNIKQIYFCPHKNDCSCECRKPNPGLLLQAARDHDIDLSKSYFIGDSKCDIDAAKNAGTTPILVLTGYGKITVESIDQSENILVFENLLEAANWIVESDC